MGERCYSILYTLFESTIESCPISYECSVSDLNECAGDTLYFVYSMSSQFQLGFHCVYCPNNGSLPCVHVPFLNESACLNAYACELHDGTVLFNLTKEQCMYDVANFPYLVQS